MNALTLLKTYNSSESENDDDDEAAGNNENKPKKLPVPAVFAKKSKLILQEVNLDGKIRNFPHEPGIWATYINVPIPPNVELLEYVSNLRHFLSEIDLNLVEDFHISVTRTVILKHHWIQDFTNIVKKNLSDIKPFKIHISDLKVYINEQKTRTFLSLKADDDFGTLNDIVEKLNCCLKEYNLKGFYSDPSFHLSILWCSGNKWDKINALLQLLPQKLNNFNFNVDVSHCLCISGNKFFRFNFQ